MLVASSLPTISAMCLILFAHQFESRYPLVVAANRDELYSRPSRHADFWPKTEVSKQLLAGKDLQAGGTWLGLGANGRFAAVTNIRDPSQPERKIRSRGELTLDFLQGNSSPEDYSGQLQTRFDEYAGFNLLIGDRESLFYLNNLHRVRERLSAGVYGLSNGLLNSPWPKVSRGRRQLQQLLQSTADLTTDQLLAIMNDRTEAPDSELPDTGIPIELERKLSSAFIHNSERRYGTLCSTAIIVDANQQCRFSEQNFSDTGNATAAHYYEFSF